MNDVIGHPELSLGLNNQKLALLGLFSKAYETQKPLTLPLFCNFDAAGGEHKPVPLAEVYYIGHLRLFASAFGTTIIDKTPAETDNGWGCFIGGCERLGRNVKKMDRARLMIFPASFSETWSQRWPVRRFLQKSSIRLWHIWHQTRPATQNRK